MGTRTTRTNGADDVLAGLRRRQRAIVEAYMHQLVPSYDRHRTQLQDMHEAGELTIAMLLRALSERRPITVEEFAFTRGYLRRAMLRGASEHELIRSARLWQRVLFDALNEEAGPDNPALVAELSRPLIDHVDLMSTLTAEVVAEIQAALRLTQREGRTELVEDLLAGRGLTATAIGAARACDLDDEAPLVVVTARPVVPFPDPAAVPVATVALAHATGDVVEPLFAARGGEELVVIRATPDDPARQAEALRDAQARLARDGVVLAVGVSAVHTGIARVPLAYGEACTARESVARDGGVLAIAILDPLGYLFVRGADDTAWSLVDPAIRTFLENDLRQAGLLVDTLVAYVDANLNVKQAAERLFVHANTAHYRLAKIQELTGRDLRDLGDLQELVVALRLARRRTGGAETAAPTGRTSPRSRPRTSRRSADA